MPCVAGALPVANGSAVDGDGAPRSSRCSRGMTATPTAQRASPWPAAGAPSLDPSSAVGVLAKHAMSDPRTHSRIATAVQNPTHRPIWSPTFSISRTTVTRSPLRRRVTRSAPEFARPTAADRLGRVDAAPDHRPPAVLALAAIVASRAGAPATPTTTVPAAPTSDAAAPTTRPRRAERAAGVRHGRSGVLHRARPHPGGCPRRPRALPAGRHLVRGHLPDHVPHPVGERRADGGDGDPRRRRGTGAVRRLPGAAVRPRVDRAGRLLRTVGRGRFDQRRARPGVRHRVERDRAGLRRGRRRLRGPGRAGAPPVPRRHQRGAQHARCRARRTAGARRVPQPGHRRARLLAGRPRCAVGHPARPGVDARPADHRHRARRAGERGRRVRAVGRVRSGERRRPRVGDRRARRRLSGGAGGDRHGAHPGRPGAGGADGRALLRRERGDAARRPARRRPTHRGAVRIA